MVKIKDLFQNRNQFDAKEIGEVSKFMFDAFFFKNENWQQSIETRIAMMNGYIEVMRQLLYSDLIQEDGQKLILVDAMDKLVAQRELFEEALRDKDTATNLVTIADNFGKKTMAPIGM